MEDLTSAEIIVGEEVIILLRDAARELKLFCLSCYGPSGKAKMICANSYGGSVMVTSSAYRLFCMDSIEFANPCAKLMVDMAKGQIQTMGDGGLFTLGMASTLLDWALESGLPRASISAAFETAASWAQQYLKSADCPAKFKVDWGSISVIQSIVRSVLKPKVVTQLSEEDLDKLSQLAIEAFLAALDEKDFGQARPLIRVLSIKGMRTAESEVLPNMVLLDTPMPPASFLPTGPVSVALFDVSLVAPEAEITMEMVASPGNSWQPSNSDLAHFEQLKNHLVRLKVGVVGCQKLVSPILRRKLQREKICVLSRLSLRHIGAMQNITGARVLNSWNTNFGHSALGILADLKVWKKNNKEYICAQASDEFLESTETEISGNLDLLNIRERRKQISTLVVCGADDIICDELDVALQSTFKVLGHTLLEPYVLAGGGCWEFFLAEQITKLAEQIPSQKGQQQIAGRKGKDPEEVPWENCLFDPRKGERAFYEALKGIADCLRRISVNSVPAFQHHRAEHTPIFNNYSRVKESVPSQNSMKMLLDEKIDMMQRLNAPIIQIVENGVSQPPHSEWKVQQFYGFNSCSCNKASIVVQAMFDTSDNQSSQFFQILNDGDQAMCPTNSCFYVLDSFFPRYQGVTLSFEIAKSLLDLNSIVKS